MKKDCGGGVGQAGLRLGVRMSPYLNMLSKPRLAQSQWGADGWTLHMV